jgi:hypothetical protein
MLVRIIPYMKGAVPSSTPPNGPELELSPPNGLELLRFVKNKMKEKKATQ